jgi:prolyl-tRNA synthetase
VVRAKGFRDFRDQVGKRRMVRAAVCGDIGCEEEIKEKTAATNRVIPLKSGTRYVRNPEQGVVRASGKCVHCGKKASHYALFARAY